MRVLIPLALAISTVVAFNQPRQDSSFMATHQQVRTDSVIQENRILQQDASFASYYTPKRQLVANGLLSCFGRMCGKSANKPASQPARQPARQPASQPKRGQRKQMEERHYARRGNLQWTGKGVPKERQSSGRLNRQTSGRHNRQTSTAGISDSEIEPR